MARGSRSAWSAIGSFLGGTLVVLIIVGCLGTALYLGTRSTGVWGDYAQPVYHKTYMDDIGLNDQPYELVARPEFNLGVAGSLSGSGYFSIFGGNGSIDGSIGSVTYISMAIMVKDTLSHIDIPMTMVDTKSKAGATPTIQFDIRIPEPHVKYELYNINVPDETIWDANPGNGEKTEAIALYGGAISGVIQKLIDNCKVVSRVCITKATITLPPELAVPNPITPTPAPSPSPTS